jgi:hypothetical protein
VAQGEGDMQEVKRNWQEALSIYQEFNDKHENRKKCQANKIRETNSNDQNPNDKNKAPKRLPMSCFGHLNFEFRI